MHSNVTYILLVLFAEWHEHEINAVPTWMYSAAYASTSATFSKSTHKSGISSTKTFDDAQGERVQRRQLQVPEHFPRWLFFLSFFPSPHCCSSISLYNFSQRAIWTLRVFEEKKTNCHISSTLCTEHRNCGVHDCCVWGVGVCRGEMWVGVRIEWVGGWVDASAWAWVRVSYLQYTSSSRFVWYIQYGVATISRLLKIIGLFCKWGMGARFKRAWARVFCRWLDTFMGWLVATISRLLKISGLFCRISSFL